MMWATVNTGILIRFSLQFYGVILFIVLSRSEPYILGRTFGWFLIEQLQIKLPNFKFTGNKLSEIIGSETDSPDLQRTVPSYVRNMRRTEIRVWDHIFNWTLRSYLSWKIPSTKLPPKFSPFSKSKDKMLPSSSTSCKWDCMGKDRLHMWSFHLSLSHFFRYRPHTIFQFLLILPLANFSSNWITSLGEVHIVVKSLSAVEIIQTLL